MNTVCQILKVADEAERCGIIVMSIEVLGVTGAAAAWIHLVGEDTRPACRVAVADVHVLDTIDSDRHVPVWTLPSDVVPVSVEFHIAAN